jgi:hypothetical protein
MLYPLYSFEKDIDAGVRLRFGPQSARPVAMKKPAKADVP